MTPGHGNRTRDLWLSTPMLPCPDPVRGQQWCAMAHAPPPPPPGTRSTAALLGRLSPMVCPLAKLGRASPSIDHPQAYHLDRGYQLRATPSLDQAYQLRNSPSIENPYQLRNSPSVDQGYHLRGVTSVETSYHHLAKSSPSLEQGYPLRGSPSLEQGYHLRGRNSPSLDCGFQLRSSPALRRASSPTLDPIQCYHPSDQTYGGGGHHKLVGRSSPSLDQGYHTLVSPSPGPSTPGPWTDPHPVPPPAPPVTTSASPFKGKRLHAKNSPFDRLPDKAALKIFEWLDSSDLCACAMVCRRWAHLAWEPLLWRTIQLRGEGVCGDRAVRGVLRRLCGQGRTGACPSVERVFLGDGAKLTDKGLTLLARRCPELTHLQLHGCAAVSNPALFELATKCSNLQHLDLTGQLCRYMGDPAGNTL
uniref:F-box domain-containing protein n=1 Tax=Timema tahoe TaxID=61484 RepID=A0A7R9FE92_9NEOP|nr:unnamed protein product [Timema tahoe]